MNKEVRLPWKLVIVVAVPLLTCRHTEFCAFGISILDMFISFYLLIKGPPDISSIHLWCLCSLILIRLMENILIFIIEKYTVPVYTTKEELKSLQDIVIMIKYIYSVVR